MGISFNTKIPLQRKIADASQLYQVILKDQALTGVIILSTQTRHYQRETLQIYLTLALFDPTKVSFNDPWPKSIPQHELPLISGPTSWRLARLVVKLTNS